MRGHAVGDTIYKVHLDGFNLMLYLMEEVAKCLREWFIYCNDGRQVVALRYDNWKLVDVGLLERIGVQIEHFRHPQPGEWISLQF